MFVVVEGPDGVGKGTVCRGIVDRIRSSHDVVLTTEPSTGEIGRHIRQILRGERANPGPVELASLYAHDRVDHLAREVMPALASGAVVVSDRYLLSSVAYQHGAGGVGLRRVLHMNRYAVTPDLTFVLLASPLVCAERRRMRGGKADAFEAAEIQERVNAVYRNADSLLPNQRIQYIEASPSADVVIDRVMTHLSPLLEKRQ
jgi:dTMP kinase